MCDRICTTCRYHMLGSMEDCELEEFETGTAFDVKTNTCSEYKPCIGETEHTRMMTQKIREDTIRQMKRGETLSFLSLGDLFL